MNMENTKLLEKVEKLSKEKKDKEYQEKLKKVIPLIKKINEVKNELITNKYSNTILTEIIENNIVFTYEFNKGIHKFNPNTLELKEILNNNFNVTMMDSTEIEMFINILEKLVNLKKIIFEFYPMKEEIIRFFYILNLCYINDFIDEYTLDFYIKKLNENLCFNSSCRINCFDCISIYFDCISIGNELEYSSCDYDVNNFYKYIIVSEANLKVIKEIEKQLEEKIDKIII